MAPPRRLPRRAFPVPYQVDFQVESKGRHLDSTKRRLVWKFGFAHPPAIFPHLFDGEGNYLGSDHDEGDHDEDEDDDGGSGSIVPYREPEEPQVGVECRGREHEIMLTWSLVTGKAHIYVDSREIFRIEPLGKDEVYLLPFAAQFHRGFDLPDPEHNGRHHVDIRCYARTPLGAKNMTVDDQGTKFRQYDLMVDGMSFFSMPAVFELGTERMWNKVSRRGLMHRVSMGLEGSHRGGGGDDDDQDERNHRSYSANDSGPKGRMVDEYHFAKAKSKRRHSGPESRYGQSITKSEYKAMSPRSESEEERMMRIAQEASTRDFEAGQIRSASSEENDSTHGNGRGGGGGGGGRGGGGRAPRGSPRKANGAATSAMAPIGEDNLIDFGEDEAARALSRINIARGSSEVSAVTAAVDDDDKTTASFMLNTAWGSDGSSGGASPRPPQPHGYANHGGYANGNPPGGVYANGNPNNGLPQPQQLQYQDPTFRQQYASRQWSSAGTVAASTQNLAPPSDISFAVPPPPTWADYNDAFGGAQSVMGGTNGAASAMGSPGMRNGGASVAAVANPAMSVGMASPGGAPPPPPPPQQYGTPHKYGTPSFGSPSVVGAGGAMMGSPAPQVARSYASPGAAMGSPPPARANANWFDPLRADPFAS